LRPARIIEADTLAITEQDIAANVGLVITSPPYPNAYEYWLYHKYRMWWLGFDPLAVKEKEIGARAHFFKKNHHTAELFVEQMRTTFKLAR
jgi:site-specific DNA-methyltransferase (cytosine-N4-specific)